MISYKHLSPLQLIQFSAFTIITCFQFLIQNYCANQFLLVTFFKVDLNLIPFLSLVCQVFVIYSNFIIIFNLISCVFIQQLIYIEMGYENSIVYNYFMKILIFILLLASAWTIKPPSPVCRVSPLPSQIPITVGEELRFDLQAVFSGYNLMLNGSSSPHISVSQKYNVTEKQYGTSYNFVSTKIRGNNRFVGLVSNGAYSGIALGVNDEQSGVTIQDYIQVEDIPNLHCYDADEITFRNDALVIVDCAVFHMGLLAFNEFLYVNLTTKKVVEGSHLSDTFVDYHSLSKRKIEILEDPFTRIPYLVRFNLRDGVSVEQQDQTYAEIFLMLNPMRPQLLDVIDNTFLQLQKLSIADVQINLGLIYILVFNRGIYELRLTRDQHLQIRSILPLQLDLNRFRVDQLGFNDDLNVVATNGNTIYQFEWDLAAPPTLVAKYTLIPNSSVRQIFTDFNFVIASVDSVINDELVRRTWVFTRRTLSYLNAYNVFHAPINTPHLIHWDQHGRSLQIFHLYNSFNIRMQLPFLNVKPVDASMAGKTEEYTVVASSLGDAGESINCTEKFSFVYLAPGDKRIIKTGLWFSNQIYVDSPDEREIPLSYEFFGSNLTYNAKFETSGPAPFAFVDKQHKAVFNWPPEINISSVVYFQMFTETSATELKPESVYGLVQTGDKSGQATLYTTYYINCKINVMDRDETHHLNCRTLQATRFSNLGRIITTSQMFDPRERRIAMVFDTAPHTIYVYYFWPEGFGYYGRKDYAGVAAQLVTGVAISKGKLFTVLEYGKRVEIFNLEDLNEPTDIPRAATPMMILNSNIMRFFGVEYFAPVGVKVSRFHNEAIFLKTKTGVMALNINEQALPELLFIVPTTNIRYDFQLNHEQLLIITEKDSTIYQLQTPLRRSDPPLKRQTVNFQFKIGQYDEVCSDRLFYIVGNQSTNVINPRFHSTSAFYAEVWVPGEILTVDAVNIADKEILFIRTKTDIQAHVFAEDPKLYVDWSNKAKDFKLSLSASNLNVSSDAYDLRFNVLDTNETIIKPTDDFNEAEVKKLGKIKAPFHNETFSADITLNDTTWFEGNVLRYIVNCSECNKSVHVTNHVQQTRELLEARAIYDIESTIDGIYAQQYSSILKTNTFNSSIHFISHVPTQRRGEVCSKLAVGQFNQYVVSLCEVGEAVHVYITSVVAAKPFTFGPYPTGAKAVNHAKIVGDILMIVDNDDNPFARAGGIYLYHLNFDLDDPDFISFLDYIDYADLQIEGFSGVPYIGSADLHLPYFSSETEYRLFISEARSGAIFVFGFQVSADGEEIIYLSKKYIELAKFIPKEIKYPTPLRVHSINIHYFFESQDKTLEYYLLLSVANWHHIELMITLNHNDDLLAFKLERVFERFPWTLGNYLKYKRGRNYDTYFAVPYIDYEIGRQLVLVYSVPYIIRADAKTYAEKYSAHKYEMLNGIVPMVRAFGSHWVRDAYEVAFAFHTFGNDKLLFTDMDGYNITELTLFKNITLNVRDLSKSQEEVQVIAQNPYTNYSFAVNLDFYKDKNDDDEEKKKEEILWIIIIAVGGIMIIGLIIAFARQQRRLKEEAIRQSKQTLLTVDDDFKNNYIDINRSSADPQSVRESVQPSGTKPEDEEEYFTH